MQQHYKPKIPRVIFQHAYYFEKSLDQQSFYIHSINKVAWKPKPCKMTYEPRFTYISLSDSTNFSFSKFRSNHDQIIAFFGQKMQPRLLHPINYYSYVQVLNSWRCDVIKPLIRPPCPIIIFFSCWEQN